MKRIVFTVMLAFVFCFPVWAVKVSSLYQVELPVATQQEDVRSEAVRDGFRQVLIKLSGNPDIDKNPLIKENIRRAEYYVQDYSYAPPSPASSTYFLKVRFDKEDTNNLLKKSGVIFWGDTRPLILVWLAVDDNVTNDIVSNEESNDLVTNLKEQGKKYGLPLIFPTMDVTDISVVSLDDVNRMNVKTLQSAGQRYAPDALLIGKLVKDQDADDWISEWKLVFDDNEWDFKVKDIDPDNIFDDVLFKAGKTLSQELMTKSAQKTQTWLKLQVANISRSNDLSDLMKFLKQLSQVQQVELSEVSGDVVQVSVLVKGNVSSFQQNAVIGQRLVFKDKNPSDSRLNFEWKH